MTIQSDISKLDAQETSLRQALCLCCFGRGGSSMLWHLLGSSPDVWMMQSEWHQATFGSMSLLRRALRRGIRRHHITSFGNHDALPDRFAQDFMRRRVEADLAEDPGLHHPDARLICMKVMDYNMFWHDGIQRAFGGGRSVILMRRPVPQCESLLRSGLTLDQACEKYNEIAGFMADLADRPGTVIVRFEDFLADPDAAMKATYAALGVAAPDSYVAKVKPYGDARQPGTDVSERRLQRFDAAELRDFVDPGVDERAWTRLAPDQLDLIARRTEHAARRIGY